MKGSSNIVSAVHSIAQAKAHFESFCREHPGSKGAKLFGGYIGKCDWVFKDIMTHPLIPQSVRDGIKKEWNSDIFAVPAIAEKAALLSVEQREMIEAVMDAMLAGEEINIVDTKTESNAI